MRTRSIGSALLPVLALLCGCRPAPTPEPSTDASPVPARLAVLWTSGDREVAQEVAFPYVMNAKRQGWFDEVQLIVWGPSSPLLSQDAGLQEYLARILEAGVEVTACRSCAENYGVATALEELGIDVKYMGQPLTEMLKTDWKVLTF